MKKNTGRFHRTEPEKCWVGDSQKICYKTYEEAEVAMHVARYDYKAPELSIYKCEYGEHYHLSSKNKSAT